MTSILSWNIQNGKGCDGKVSLRRIAEVIRDTADADVLCLQEVSRGLDLGGGEDDQVAEIAGLFPGYETAFGAGIDAFDTERTGRWQFGNLVLSRVPLLSVLHHPLPRPADGGRRHMQRVCTEAVIEADGEPLRLVNLHLEYHSAVQRAAQLQRLRSLQGEALDSSRQPPLETACGPYRSIPRPVDAVFCGDFNMAQGSAQYRAFLQPIDGEESFADAWEIVHPRRTHDPTCGVHDRAQWPEGPHCRDFFFVAGDCVDAVREVRVNTLTDASDHQPLVIELSR